MRPSLALLATSLALTPSLALASPFARVHALQAPSDPSLQPTSSKAPESKDLPDQPLPEEPPKVEAPAPEPAPIAPPPEEKPKWNRHGIGVRGGLTVIPTWAVSKRVQSMTNALCRGTSVPDSKWSAGLSRVDGCNFYVGGEYIYRYTENFDIVPAIAYHQIKAPDGLWLDDEEKNPDGSPELGAADYTQVNFSHVAIQVDFIGRGNLIKTPDFKWQLGGGGGIGLGVITGFGFLQTPLGNPGSPGGATCNSLEDYKDFTKCTPHYQDPEANDIDGPPPQGSLTLDADGPNVGRFAKCTTDRCNGNDLDALGRKKGVNLPVIPIINILVTMRFLIKDTFGINITGGWQTGFYFGGSLQYFFGPK
ncbi:MAG: hypothetical protein H0T76_16210 [Nannocystis sp.]|nr:hypothetical protein [Nannocystis sp.]MBA3548025.1 hypothetical protein [Nannocystis sp.]